MTDVQPVPTDPQALAEAVTAAMWSRDRTAQALGMRIESVGPGRATVRMTVRGDMVNGHHICHGGLIFTLADTAFAYACNEGDQPTVASGADITFTKASHAGDTLTATAVRRWQSGRNGLYDITVTDQHGELVAEFRGRSFTTNRTLPTGSK